LIEHSNLTKDEKSTLSGEKHSTHQ